MKRDLRSSTQKPLIALVVAAACICLCVATDARSDRFPHLMWRITDEELEFPLGAITDVGVDGDMTVYLLDRQVKEVRRITADGDELPPLGREGEGPGEFMHPALVSGVPSGGCVVVQDFYAPAVCLLPAGHPCPAPDLALIRDLFGTTLFMATARSDEKGRLLVVATTTEIPYDKTRPAADLGSATSVFRVQPGEKQATVLFTNSQSLGDERTVRFGNIGFYPIRSWDVHPTGRLIYADPEGRSRVLIGHPADGPVEVLDLPAVSGDEEGIARRARAENRSPDSYPRIADVQWIGSDRFLIKPVAADPGVEIQQTGIVELFDTTGSSLGRRTIVCDYDPDQDTLFQRGGIIVIIKSGRSALLASFRTKPGEPVVQFEDEIIVEAYDLTRQ
ncbi:MAG: hypothetical protein OEY32_01255 [Candidatus Krumholzibacteria bacterium]|nr:hypothetical protein [Candidatus Krumholzibacteria bacterium]MDH5268536.1 hypothetical protein [Candidatus Krumholzibacteria bacterium]